MANAIRIDTYADRALQSPIEATLRAAKISTRSAWLWSRISWGMPGQERPVAWRRSSADVSPARHLVEAESRASSFQPAISWIDFAGQSLDQLRW